MMLFKDTVTIKSDPPSIWETIGNPGTWASFHHKIDLIECANRSRGGRVDAILNFKNREILCKGIITRLQDYSEIQVDFEGTEADRKPERFTVNYRLARGLRGTKLIETVTFDTQVNLFWRLLIKFITIFGSTVGKNHLKELKARIEN